jgi:drug/metabolite transporter (DMT)-like permease
MVDAETEAEENEELLKGADKPMFRKKAESRHWADYFQPSTIAPLLAALACVLFSLNGELLQALQVHSGGSHVSPLLNLILCHLGGLAFAPKYMILHAPGTDASSEVLNLRGVALRSLLLAVLLMGYNYAWLSSARYVAVGLTNAIFQTSIAFVYLASVALFSDTHVAAPQICGVVLSLVGSALASGVGNGTVASATHELVLGVSLALMASVGCMMYQVCFKIMFGQKKNDARFLAHVGAWVSIWHILVMLPLAGIADIIGFEVMEFPRERLIIFGTMASAIIASTVNALYLCMVMWGSSMLLPCSAAFSVPLTVALDMLLHQARPSRMEVIGQFMVVLSVGLILDIQKQMGPFRALKMKAHADV